MDESGFGRLKRTHGRLSCSLNDISDQNWGQIWTQQPNLLKGWSWPYWSSNGPQKLLVQRNKTENQSETCSLQKLKTLDSNWTYNPKIGNCKFLAGDSKYGLSYRFWSLYFWIFEAGRPQPRWPRRSQLRPNSIKKVHFKQPNSVVHLNRQGGASSGPRERYASIGTDKAYR